MIRRYTKGLDGILHVLSDLQISDNDEIFIRITSQEKAIEKMNKRIQKSTKNMIKKQEELIDKKKEDDSTKIEEEKQSYKYRKSRLLKTNSIVSNKQEITLEGGLVLVTGSDLNSKEITSEPEKNLINEEKTPTQTMNPEILNSLKKEHDELLYKLEEIKFNITNLAIKKIELEDERKGLETVIQHNKIDIQTQSTYLAALINKTNKIVGSSNLEEKFEVEWANKANKDPKVLVDMLDKLNKCMPKYTLFAASQEVKSGETCQILSELKDGSKISRIISFDHLISLIRISEIEVDKLVQIHEILNNYDNITFEET